LAGEQVCKRCEELKLGVNLMLLASKEVSVQAASAKRGAGKIQAVPGDFNAFLAAAMLI
jgi:hypothetical protein